VAQIVELPRIPPVTRALSDWRSCFPRLKRAAAPIGDKHMGFVLELLITAMIFSWLLYLSDSDMWVFKGKCRSQAGRS
jgi:hypothetical protein